MYRGMGRRQFATQVIRGHLMPGWGFGFSVKVQDGVAEFTRPMFFRRFGICEIPLVDQGRMYDIDCPLPSRSRVSQR